MNAPISATTLQDQTHISHRAMLVSFHRTGTSNRVRDKDAEDVVKQQLGDEDWIVSRKVFQDKSSPIYTYQQLRAEQYGFHIKATLPYSDGGDRVLPNQSYFDYTSKMGNYDSQCDVLKQKIVANYNLIVQHDISLRNTKLAADGKPQSACIDDYPSLAQISARLNAKWILKPIESSSDFRFDIPQEMKDRLDAQINEAINVGKNDIVARMLKPVTAFIAKLADYKGEKGQRFSPSFVDNLNSLNKELAPLNVDNDPTIVTALAQIDAVIKPFAFAPDALKEDEVARASMKSKLEALENTLKGYSF